MRARPLSVLGSLPWPPGLAQCSGQRDSDPGWWLDEWNREGVEAGSSSSGELFFQGLVLCPLCSSTSQRTALPPQAPQAHFVLRLWLLTRAENLRAAVCWHHSHCVFPKLKVPPGVVQQWVLLQLCQAASFLAMFPAHQCSKQF